MTKDYNDHMISHSKLSLNSSFSRRSILFSWIGWRIYSCNRKNNQVDDTGKLAHYPRIEYLDKNCNIKTVQDLWFDPYKFSLSDYFLYIWMSVYFWRHDSDNGVMWNYFPSSSPNIVTILSIFCLNITSIYTCSW